MNKTILKETKQQKKENIKFSETFSGNTRRKDYAFRKCRHNVSQLGSHVIRQRVPVAFQFE